MSDGNGVEARAASSRSRSEWQELVAAYERRSVSRRAFCLEAGISPTTFDYWRKKLRGGSKPATPAGFVELGPVRVAGEPALPGWEVELTLGDGMVLRLTRR